MTDLVDETVIKTDPIKEDVVPSSKLSDAHGVFMANIDVVSSPRRGSAITSSNAGSLGGNHSASGSNVSTKVIETLHDQIDTLTSTNLQLTVQSHSLLDKLDGAQQKEAKLLETIASLKHENENLSTMLNRKTRKLKEVETDLSQLKLEVQTVNEENDKLNKDFVKLNETESQTKLNMEMIQNQYDTVVDSHEYYKRKYTKEIDSLRVELQNLKDNQKESIGNMLSHIENVDNKVSEVNMKYSNLETSNEQFNKLLQESCQKTITALDINQWIELFNKSKSLVSDYAKEMNIALPDDFISATNTSAAIEKESKFVRPSKELDGLKVVKLRNVSPNTGNAHINKRSSYYGNAVKTFSQPSSLPGTLPGVKRSTSIRKVSSRIPSSASNSASSSPILGSNGFGHNDSTTNGNNENAHSRVSSSSSNYRKKRSSIIFHGS